MLNDHNAIEDCLAVSLRDQVISLKHVFKPFVNCSGAPELKMNISVTKTFLANQTLNALNGF